MELKRYQGYETELLKFVILNVIKNERDNKIADIFVFEDKSKVEVIGGIQLSNKIPYGTKLEKYRLIGEIKEIQLPPKILKLLALSSIK